MDYKEKYKALVAVLKQARADERKGYTFASVIDSVAPYIAKTKDEIIIDEIINFIKITKPDYKNWKDYSSWITYLEKQKYEYEVFEPVESTLEYKMGFKAGVESVKQKE